MNPSSRFLAPTRQAISSAMAPDDNLQEGDELPFFNDKHYALHGKIMLLVIVLVFSLFIAFIVLIPRLRRARSSASGGSGDSNAHQKSPTSSSYVTTEISLQSKGEIRNKFPS